MLLNPIVFCVDLYPDPQRSREYGWIHCWYGSPLPWLENNSFCSPQCDFMDGRDAFLTMARDKHYEFSSLRRCKYSTLVMLYELHTQVNKWSFLCNRIGVWFLGVCKVRERKKGTGCSEGTLPLTNDDPYRSF